MAFKAFCELIKTEPIVVLHIEDSLIYALSIRKALLSMNPKIQYYLLTDDHELGRISNINPNLAIVDYDLGRNSVLKGDHIIEMIRRGLPDIIIIGNSAIEECNQLLIKAGANDAVTKGMGIINLLFNKEDDKGGL